MSTDTGDLHGLLIESLGESVEDHSLLDSKPLELDLRAPLPSQLRCYVYNLVDGGARRPNEFKAVLRVPGQPVGQYGSFDHSGGRVTMVLAYRSDLDVWVLWDALLHPRFKNGGNIQVRRSVVLDAAVSGGAEQTRRVKGGHMEQILACRSDGLGEAIRRRFMIVSTDRSMR